MQSELTPRQHLERLVERADPARQNREGIGPLCHDAFAIVHRIDDDQLADILMRQFGIAQCRRDNPDHLSAGGQGSVGGDAH